MKAWIYYKRLSVKCYSMAKFLLTCREVFNVTESLLTGANTLWAFTACCQLLPALCGDPFRLLWEERKEADREI